MGLISTEISCIGSHWPAANYFGRSHQRIKINEWRLCACISVIQVSRPTSLKQTSLRLKWDRKGLRRGAFPHDPTV
jgi:hypothetical protein